MLTPAERREARNKPRAHSPFVVGVVDQPAFGYFVRGPGIEADWLVDKYDDACQIANDCARYGVTKALWINSYRIVNA